MATQGIPVTVGVEVPAGNQARLETFLASEGGEEDWRKLMESSFWRSPYPDGRNSEAVAYLLEALRKLRAQGMDVRLFAYDHPLWRARRARRPWPGRCWRWPPRHPGGRCWW
ncbi:hypothetical protein ACN28S_06835 [Cystobacter fuscus]